MLRDQTIILVPAAAQQIPSLSVLQFQMSKGAVTLPLSKQYFTVNLDHKQKKSLVYSRYNQVSSPMWYINQYACISLHRSVLGHKSGARYNLKIIKARLDMVGKKPSFDKGEVTCVEIKESTATVAHIASEIRGVWGQEYRIVTSDGMEVRDSSGTRGKHYLIWSYIV